MATEVVLKEQVMDELKKLFKKTVVIGAWRFTHHWGTDFGITLDDPMEELEIVVKEYWELRHPDDEWPGWDEFFEIEEDCMTDTFDAEFPISEIIKWTL